jgi:hypothetical protein
MEESKSLLEVWEWKEAVYNDTKDMTSKQVVKYFSESTDKFLKKNGYLKIEISKNVFKLVKAN